MLADHYRRSVWLNPEPAGRWRGTTIATIAEVFDMYPMTVAGLTDAMAALGRGTSPLCDRRRCTQPPYPSCGAPVASGRGLEVRDVGVDVVRGAR